MAFNPLSLLILKYRGRSVAVFRDHCYRHESVLAVARRTFRSLQDVPADEFVLLSEIPGHPDTALVELSIDVWTVVCHVVHSVTIMLESEIVQDPARGSATACSSPVSPASSEKEMLALPGALSPTPPSLSPTLPRSHRLSSPTRPPTFRRARAPEKRLPRPSEVARTGDVVQTVKVSFPGHLKPVPMAFDISEVGLLGKKLSHLFEIVTNKTAYSSSNSTVTHNGNFLDFDSTLSDQDVASGDTIVVNPITRVRKPVIYLYPPFSLPDVTVELSLVSSWSFSAVYPPPRTTDSPPNERRAGQAGQSLTWTIAAEPDGTLLDKSSGLEVSYLYWEATATSSSRLLTPVVSRAATPIEGNRDTETFDPSRPSVNPDDSILLHTSKVPGYLDTALKALALNTEARTSFITFWLPDLVKHEYVALRFIAQESYEKAARMRISPVPDVVTRVFMLFRGVAPEDLALWESASARADNATFWAGVVGVNVARASDRGLFRVLEWGGMEVK